MRLGWFTSTEFFATHLEALTDSSVQHPHGMGQLYIAELLSPTPRGWGFDGYIHWCKLLAIEYERKRDLLFGLLREGFGDDWGVIARADVPVAGMFVCLQIVVDKLSFYNPNEPLNLPGGARTNTVKIMEQLFEHLLDAGVVVMPAVTFAIVSTTDSESILDVRRAVLIGHYNMLITVHYAPQRTNFFRLTFAGTDETIRSGASLVVQAVKGFFSQPSGA